ncbi:hypothetical protein SLEP1_g42051 [Rubroshorea leprosula]|uniref:Uncharacterized protein n=1 Tax=Rubroshorea leprosula TaxID=152421 RepID=A0AAV5L8U5_9ROSI|nr:hypothetical protein SLEP1_g42051 [Rubroshorea leprosula]
MDEGTGNAQVPKIPCQGTLRDLSKKSQDHSLIPIEQGDSEANDLDCGTSIHTNDNLVPFPNGGNSALIAEH